MRKEICLLADLFLATHKLDKQTELRGEHISYCLPFFICGGPCHLSSSKQSFGTLFSSENGCFIHLWKKIRKSLYHYLVNGNVQNHTGARQMLL